MLCIRVDLLTDCYSATAFNDRNTAEWPPHPARLFSALVATWADNGSSINERNTLIWLESQDPPEIACDLEEHVSRRNVLTHFVPVNDAGVVGTLTTTYAKLAEAHQESAIATTSQAASRSERLLAKAVQKSQSDSQREANKTGAPLSGLQLLPEARGKQARTYPSITPQNPTVHFIWRDAEPMPSHLEALDQLLSRVARLGHSSSMIACSISETDDKPVYVQSPAGALQCRIPTVGLLDSLEAAFTQHRGIEPRVLPNRIVSYGTPRSRATPRSNYDTNWIILKPTDGQLIPITHVQGWARALRASFLSHATEQLDFIAGHEIGSSAPRKQGHPAWIALPFAGAPHADAMIRGFAVVVPRLATDVQRSALLAALSAWRLHNNLTLRSEGGKSLTLEQVLPEDSIATLRPQRWCHSSQYWTSITPIVLDRFPKHLFSQDQQRRERGEQQACATIARSIMHLGLPTPRRIQISLDAMVTGTAPIRSFRPYRHGKANQSRPISVHASIQFDQAVEGPILLGAGHHLGYGLLAPHSDHSGSTS